MPLALRARPVALAVALVATPFAARSARADMDAPQTTRAAGGYMGIGLEAEPDGTLRVVSVVPSSPASAAGITPGDIIVRARGGTPGSVDTFTLSVRAAGPNAEYPLDLRRGTRQMHVTVRLGNAPQQGVSIGQPPPVLVSQVVMGPGPGDLEQLRGRVVLLDFWASWCGPCRMVMPILNQMHQRYAAQGLTVLGVTDEPASTARLVGQQMSIQYTLATEATAQTRFGVRNLPTLVVLDRRGNVRRVTVGVDANEMRNLDRLVQQLLAEPASP
jgi:thiol-disulfide isomerase/thioredoxin